MCCINFLVAEDKSYVSSYVLNDVYYIRFTKNNHQDVHRDDMSDSNVSNVHFLVHSQNWDYSHIDIHEGRSHHSNGRYVHARCMKRSYIGVKVKDNSVTRHNDGLNNSLYVVKDVLSQSIRVVAVYWSDANYSYIKSHSLSNVFYCSRSLSSLNCLNEDEVLLRESNFNENYIYDCHNIYKDDSWILVRLSSYNVNVVQVYTHYGYIYSDNFFDDLYSESCSSHSFLSYVLYYDYVTIRSVSSENSYIRYSND